MQVESVTFTENTSHQRTHSSTMRNSTSSHSHIAKKLKILKPSQQLTVSFCVECGKQASEREMKLSICCCLLLTLSEVDENLTAIKKFQTQSLQFCKTKFADYSHIKIYFLGNFRINIDSPQKFSNN